MFWKRRKDPVADVTAEKVFSLIEEGRPPVLVDVRKANEYAAGHLPGAVNIPFDEIIHRSGELNPAELAVFY